MTPARSLLRGAAARLGDELSFDGQPRDVLVEHGRIVAIAPAGSIAQPEHVIELPRRLLAPGLVNGHQHSHEHFQRGRTENLPLALWPHLVRGRMPLKLTPRQAYLRAQIGAIEALRTGCTTLVDDLALGGAIDREPVDAVLQAYDDSGVRALLGFAMMDKPMVDNFPFVDALLPAPLAASLRPAPRPRADQFVALMHGLATSRHPHERRGQLQCRLRGIHRLGIGRKVGVLKRAGAEQRAWQSMISRPDTSISGDKRSRRPTPIAAILSPTSSTSPSPDGPPVPSITWPWLRRVAMLRTGW